MQKAATFHLKVLSAHPVVWCRPFKLHINNTVHKYSTTLFLSKTSVSLVQIVSACQEVDLNKQINVKQTHMKNTPVH